VSRIIPSISYPRITKKYFLHVCHDYLQSIRAAFRERDNARLTVAALEEDHEDKKKRVSQLEDQSSKVC
jgi:hypothetical protein